MPTSGRRIERSSARRAIVLAAMAAAFAVPPASAAEPDCFEQLQSGKEPVIACEFPTRLTADERADLQRITRGVLQDASCLVAISIERRLVDAALAARDHVFEAPPQPVTCKVVTQERAFTISATFSPRVVIKEGIATEATPGMSGVNGVSRLLSWPVIQYVNHSGRVRDGLLRIVNAYFAFYGPEARKRLQ